MLHSARGCSGSNHSLPVYNSCTAYMRLTSSTLASCITSSLLQVIHVEIDASDVPADYILSILSQCSTFPEVLIFFLRGHLTAQYLWQRQYLATIDTYFMISCTDGGTVPPKQLGHEVYVAQGGGGGGRGIAVGRGGMALQAPGIASDWAGSELPRDGLTSEVRLEKPAV